MDILEIPLIYSEIESYPERSDTKSNVKLGGFRSQFQAPYVFGHTEELWYNETVSLWMTIYIYIYIYSVGFGIK